MPGVAVGALVGAGEVFVGAGVAVAGGTVGVVLEAVGAEVVLVGADWLGLDGLLVVIGGGVTVGVTAAQADRITARMMNKGRTGLYGIGDFLSIRENRPFYCKSGI